MLVDLRGGRFGHRGHPQLDDGDSALFLIIKGMGLAKIKAFFSLLKMYSSIKQRKVQLNKKRKLSDNEIIIHFVNEIHLSEAMSKNKFSFLCVVL